MSETKTCPYCAEEIKADAIVCRYCGRPMPGHEEEVPQAAPAPEGGTRRRGLTVGLSVVAIILLVVVAVYVLLQTGVLGSVGIQILPTSTPTAVPTAESCRVQAQVFLGEVEDLVDKWADAYDLASSTSRMSLPSVISQLQEIRREASNVEVPWCARQVKNAMISHMDNAIDGFMAFMAQEEDNVVSEKFEAAADDMTQFVELLGKLRAGESPFD